MRLKVKSVDVRRLSARAAKAADGALFAVAENVLSDCSEYVPYETGALRGSGTASASAGKATVAWGTDADTARYARVQYYGVGLGHGTDANAAMAPKACAKWFEAAKAVRKGAWGEMYAHELRRNL